MRVGNDTFASVARDDAGPDDFGKLRDARAAGGYRTATEKDDGTRCVAESRGRGLNCGRVRCAAASASAVCPSRR